MSKLILIPDKNNGGEFALRDGVIFTLGRHGSCEILLPGRMISRKHATIKKKGENYYLSDTKSFNGTFLNSKRVTGTRKLNNGDEIKIANRILRFIEETPDSISETEITQVGSKSPAIPLASEETEEFPMSTDEFDDLWSNITNDSEIPVPGKTAQPPPTEDIPTVEKIPEPPPTEDIPTVEKIAEPSPTKDIPIPLPIPDFEITQDVFSLAGGNDEEQNKLAEVRGYVNKGSLAGDPIRFLQTLRQYVKLNPRNPETMELLEVFAGNRTRAKMANEEISMLNHIIAEIEKHKPEWMTGERFKNLKQTLYA
ncbi:FHA domain-containing protein [Acidobacteriota bacterium]